MKTSRTAEVGQCRDSSPLCTRSHIAARVASLVRAVRTASVAAVAFPFRGFCDCVTVTKALKTRCWLRTARSTCRARDSRWSLSRADSTRADKGMRSRGDLARGDRPSLANLLKLLRQTVLQAYVRRANYNCRRGTNERRDRERGLTATGL